MNHDPFDAGPPGAGRTREPQSDFEEFEATELFCPNCRRPVPVRKFLLLVLPDGDKYEYQCRYCGTKVGDKTDRSAQPFGILET
jgi:hypothetical protein